MRCGTRHGAERVLLPSWLFSSVIGSPASRLVYRHDWSHFSGTGSGISGLFFCSSQTRSRLCAVKFETSCLHRRSLVQPVHMQQPFFSEPNVFGVQSSIFLTFPTNLISALVVAMLSYHLLERPLTVSEAGLGLALRRKGQHRLMPKVDGNLRRCGRAHDVIRC